MGKRLTDIKKSLQDFKGRTLGEVLSVLKEKSEGSSLKIDESFEFGISLNLKVGKVTHTVRSFVDLPHGSGKKVRVLALVPEDKVDLALKAGADLAGNQDLVDAIFQGKQALDFDRCVATPDIMPVVGKIGKILGPKGLMPNPKIGTVTLDFEKTILSLKGGRVSFSADKQGWLKTVFGKVGFSVAQLEENFMSLYRGVQSLAPSGLKVPFVAKVYVATSMGPSLFLDVDALTGGNV